MKSFYIVNHTFSMLTGPYFQYDVQLIEYEENHTGKYLTE